MLRQTIIIIIMSKQIQSQNNLIKERYIYSSIVLFSFHPWTASAFTQGHHYEENTVSVSNKESII